MGPLIAPGLKAERRFARGAFETWRFGKVKVSGLEVAECWSFLVSLCSHFFVWEQASASPADTR